MGWYKIVGEKRKELLIQFVVLAYVILFTYAAISKILDFETFTVQLAQSPLLSAYAEIIAWLVPGIELLIAGLFIFPRFRILALYASFTLMVMFTTYIHVILNYSDFIPCSCGGVLEKLSWTQHLIFNVVFIVMAGVSILFTKDFKIKKKVLLLTLLAIFGIAAVTLLFVFSEKKMHRNNAFIRRYPHHPLLSKDTIDLKYNSYYFAGVTDNYIYLGNYTAPLNVFQVSLDFKDTISYRIKLSDRHTEYKSPRVRVLDSTFYLMDGQAPVINTGNVANWEVTKTYNNIGFFTVIEPIKKDTLGIRTISSASGKNVLGSIKLSNNSITELYADMLDGTLDGYFDRDGMLVVNDDKQKLIYVYYYKNEYLVVDSGFKLFERKKTIDTITKAVLDVQEFKSKNQSALGSGTITVNGISASSGNYLLINSSRMGKYEPNQDLKRVSIMDVYNLDDGTYSFSFYLYRHNQENLLGLKLKGRNLYVILDTYLIRLEFKPEFIIDH
jgi:hypothetical protein